MAASVNVNVRVSYSSTNRSHAPRNDSNPPTDRKSVRSSSGSLKYHSEVSISQKTFQDDLKTSYNLKQFRNQCQPEQNRTVLIIDRNRQLCLSVLQRRSLLVSLLLTRQDKDIHLFSCDVNVSSVVLFPVRFQDESLLQPHR